MAQCISDVGSLRFYIAAKSYPVSISKPLLMMSDILFAFLADTVP